MIRVLDTRQEGTNRVIQLSQEKFCTDPSKVDSKYQWMIPLTFCSSSNPKQAIYSTLMDGKTMTVTIPNVGENEWIKVYAILTVFVLLHFMCSHASFDCQLNPGTVGFYRVKYPAEMLEQFLPAIEQKLLLPVDRLNLLDDLFALVQSGQTSTTNVNTIKH